MGGYVYDPYSGTMKYDPFAAGDSGMPAPQTSSMPPMMAGASAPQPQPEYKPKVPDVMTGLNKVVDGFFGSSRSPSGSFDPNRVESIISKLPAEQQEEARLKFALAKEQSDLFNKSRPNTSNFNLGNIFQGLGAVAYMTSKNPQVWSHSQAALNRIYQGNDDREKSARAYDMAGMKAYSDVLGDLGDSAADTMRKKREKRDAAVQAASDMVKKANPGNQAFALEKAAQMLELNGFELEAREFRRRAKQMGGAAPAPQAGSPTAGNVVLGSEPAYEGARGTQRVTPANPSDPGQVGTPGYVPQPMSANRSIYGDYDARIKALLNERNRREIQGVSTKDLDDEIATIGNIVEAGPKEFAQQRNKMRAEDAAKAERGAETAQKAGGFLDKLHEYSNVPGIDYYIGPIQGSSVAPYTTDLLAGLARGNEANPALRDQIKGTQMALVSLLKERIRTPGEGSQDQREFQALIDTIGDFSNARNVNEYRQKLADAEERISILLGGVKIPRKSTDVGGGGGEPPQRTSTAKESPIGAERVNARTGKTMVKVGPNQWVEKDSKQMPDVVAP